MTKNAHAAVANVNKAWLQEQYVGLAGTIAVIHGPTDGHRGYHHDIKPSNILVFRQNSTLKLGDWGCAAMNADDARQTSLKTDKRALAPYLPPGSINRTPTSRPHDIWSLECVFLELLTWFLLDGEDARQLLRKQIKDERNNTKNCWFLAGGSHMVRSRTVNGLIVEMRKRDGGRWRAVVDAIDKMLTIEPAERIIAKGVLEELSV